MAEEPTSQAKQVRAMYSIMNGIEVRRLTSLNPRSWFLLETCYTLDKVSYMLRRRVFSPRSLFLAVFTFNHSSRSFACFPPTQSLILFSIPLSFQNNLGGGEGVEGLYGSITGMHMQRMLTIMRERCGLDASSHLVDIGAGLGRPLLHALVSEGISGATGIELDYIKCMKADAFLKQTANALLKRQLIDEAITLPVIECKPVEKVRSLEPATHAYSFWEGVPVDARVAFGRLFAASPTLRSVTVVQRSMRFEDPEEVMEYGYCFGPVTLVETLSVSMSGSNRSFTAYVFNKTQPPVVVPRRPRGARAARGAPAPVVVGTPPLSGDNAKVASKNSSDVIGSDGVVAKKLDLAEIEVVSPVKRRGPARQSRKRNDIEKEIEEEEVVAVVKRATRATLASPMKKAKTVVPAAVPPPAVSTRASPRKQPSAAERRQRRQRQQQRPLLAALTTRSAVRVTRRPQQQQQQKQQKLVVNQTKKVAMKSTQSPSKSALNREARGLLGANSGGDGGVGLFSAAELLEGSVYPRTRHAVTELLSK